MSKPSGTHAMNFGGESVSQMPQGTLFTEDFLNEGIRETEA
jgi:hypothetical protein